MDRNTSSDFMKQRESILSSYVLLTIPREFAKVKNEILPRIVPKGLEQVVRIHSSGPTEA